MIRWSPATPPRPGCPHRRLIRLLATELGEGAVVGPSTLRPWASANFVGARHLFECSIPEISIDVLRERLSATEWRLSGHIVADIAVEPGEDQRLTIEILTVED